MKKLKFIFLAMTVLLYANQLFAGGQQEDSVDRQNTGAPMFQTETSIPILTIFRL